VTNLFAPAALADDGFCYSKIDVNCDWIVDGQDLGYLLGAWGTGDRTLDFDGDCTVGGGDLAYMLGNWGALPPPPEWQDMHFANEEVNLCLGTDTVYAVLNGSIMIDPYQGRPIGSIQVELQEAVYASIEFDGDSTVIFSGMSKLTFSGSDPSGNIHLNGQSMPIGEALDDLGNDMSEYGIDPLEWEEHCQMMMALSMVHQSEMYIENMIVVQNNGGGQGPPGGGEPGFFCKAAAIAAGSAITALATLGCLALTGSCALGSTVTFGGIAIPCAALIALCAGGVFAGGASAYELALAYWSD